MFCFVLFSLEILDASLDKLLTQIYYSNLLVEGSLNEPALLLVCKEILQEKGTLPVGEIGKILQELASFASFSNKLKEKFGGLKKFLERFSDLFVISTDHPFNPHVFMRKTLTSEELDIIGRGIVPPSLTAKFKKVR